MVAPYAATPAVRADPTPQPHPPGVVPYGGGRRIQRGLPRTRRPPPYRATPHPIPHPPGVVPYGGGRPIQRHDMSGSSVKTTNLKPSVASKVRQQTLTKWCGSCRTAAYCCQQCRAQGHTSRETLPKRRILRSNLFWRSCVLYTI